MELTDAQKRKIEENRLKALAILEAKKREEPRFFCQFRSESDQSPCSSTNIDMELYDVFGERVCSVCKLHNEMFDLITKSEAVSTYLVTDDSLTTLKYKSRDNPHNPGWTPMKLFLRKHVHALSMRRFGDESKLADEKKERESQKYERFLIKTGDVLSNSTRGLRADLNAHPESFLDSVTADDVVDSKRKRGGKPQTESQKRKKVALGNLVNIIRGKDKS